MTPMSKLYAFKTQARSSHRCVIELAGIGHGHNLIDVGCGSGHLIPILEKNGWIVTGVEPDPSSALEASRVSSRIYQSKLEEYIADEKFDCVVAADVLEHACNRSDFIVLLKRLMKPDGRLIISVPNVAHLSVRLNILFGRFEYTDRGILDKTHRSFFTKKSILRFLEDSSLQITRTLVTPAPIELKFPWILQSHFGGLLYSILGKLSVFSKGLFAYQFVVECVLQESNQ